MSLTKCAILYSTVEVNERGYRLAAKRQEMIILLSLGYGIFRIDVGRKHEAKCLFLKNKTSCTPLKQSICIPKMLWSAN
jgi:hypothetical protein